MMENETIAAFCTAPGGALAIIRISGPDALTAAEKVWKGTKPLSKNDPRRLTFGHVRRDNDEPGETCLAVFMPGPASYTGEDVVELQCHGGVLAPKLLLDAIYRTGVRPALPGEFTRRAFLNGKMDLSQAEAVADLYSAGSKAAFHLAEKQLSGRLGSRIRSTREQLNHILAEIESRLDFPEENLDWIPVDQLKTQLEGLHSELETLLSSSGATAVFRNGVRLVIAGSPNTGKSSLLNWLLGYERAIVSDIPGTTRDTLRENITIRGIPVTVTDTAGLRKNALDPIEEIGIKRSKSSIDSAQIVFWMFDVTRVSTDELTQMKTALPQGVSAIAVWNKADIAPSDFIPPKTEIPSVLISLHKQTGLEELLDLFTDTVWGGSPDRTEPDCAVAARHAAAIRDALSALHSAIAVLDEDHFELAASGIRAAGEALGVITGETARLDVLDEIFSRFCIGK